MSYDIKRVRHSDSHLTMKENEENIKVPLARQEQDYLQRLGLEYLLNTKYGPSLKMFWARLVENRTPIFFGAFVISFTAFLITASIKNDANVRLKEQAEKITELTLAKHKLQKAFDRMTYREIHGLGQPQHVDRKPEKIIVEFYGSSEFNSRIIETRIKGVLTGLIDPKITYGKAETTVLHNAISVGVSYPTIKRLVEAGADPNHQIKKLPVDMIGLNESRQGNTVLVALIKKGRWECAVNLIKDFKIDKSAKNQGNKTAYDILISLAKQDERFYPHLAELKKLLDPTTTVAQTK